VVVEVAAQNVDLQVLKVAIEEEEESNKFIKFVKSKVYIVDSLYN
jgi:hypothetical protein